MSLFEKMIRIVIPTVVFGFIGLLVMTQSTSRPTYGSRVSHEFISWLSSTIGAVPAGFLFILVGIAWSMSVYYKLSRQP